MDFVISSRNFLSALQRASGALNPNAKLIPITENFHLELIGKQLTVSATTMDISIQTEVDVVESISEGAIVVPGNILLEALKSMPDNPITFKLDEQSVQVEVTSEYGKYALAGFEPDDFPEIQELPEGEFLEFSSDKFELGYSQTSIATFNEDASKAMSGVSLKIEDGKLVFAATDGHRLIKNLFYCETGELNKSVILSKRGFLPALRPLLVPGEDIKLYFSKEYIFIVSSRGVFSSRLIEGVFPNYEGVIPTNNPNMLYLDRLDFINTVKRVALFSNQATYMIVMDLKPQSLTISSKDFDFNRSGDEQFPCTYEGEAMTVGFNGRFIIEMLSVLESEQVRFELLDEKRATLVFPEEKLQGQEITLLVMPVAHY